MTATELAKPPYWSPETGFNYAGEVAKFRSIFFEQVNGLPCFNSYDINAARDRCDSNNVFFPVFLEQKNAIKETLFPLNRVLYKIEKGKAISEPSLGERLQDQEETLSEADCFIFEFFLQPAFIEAPSLYLMFNAGEKTEFVSTIEVLRLYYTIMLLLEEKLFIVIDYKKYQDALEKRNAELIQTLQFVQLHLLSTAEYQTVLLDQNPETIRCLRDFLTQYTIRVITVLERFLIRIFDDRFSPANQVMLSSGRVKHTSAEDEKERMKVLTLHWYTQYEMIYRDSKKHVGANGEPLGNLPKRELLFEKLKSGGDDDGSLFALYTLWWFVTVQFVEPQTD